MENIVLDKNYNILEEKGLYHDDFIDLVDSIAEAKLHKRISEQDATFLLNIVLKREFKNEAKAILPFSKQNPEILSFFMSLKTKQVKNA